MELYGTIKPPVTDISKINSNSIVPIGLFVGKYDIMTHTLDSEKLKNELEKGKNLVEYTVFEGGHSTFLFGKDATYFSKDVMNLVRKYSPK